jgi:hypothetical protein
MARESGPITPKQLTVVPANEASRDDLDERELAHQRHKRKWACTRHVEFDHTSAEIDLGAIDDVVAPRGGRPGRPPPDTPQGLASYTMLNGVSATRRNRPNPASAAN